MATLTKITRADLAPMNPVSAASLKVQAVDNQDSLRLLTYGSRPIIGAATGHNHAGDGGELIRGRPILSLAVGPTFNAAGSGGENTVPREGVYMAPYEDDVDSDTERPLISAPVVLPGGVKGVTVHLLVYSSDPGGLDTIVVKASLRDFASHGQDFEGGTTEVTGLANSTSLTDGYLDLTIDLSDLSPLGDPAQDRECELVAWQAFSGAAASIYRLVHVALVPFGTSAGGRVARAGDAPLSVVHVADAKAKAPVTSDFSARLRTRVNQEAQALLGRAPGFGPDARTPDRRRPYTQLIEGAHPHEGVLVAVGDDEFEARGAVLVEQYAVSTYSTGGLTSGTVSQQRGAQVNPRGILVGFPGGTSGDTQAIFQFRCSVPAGLGALLVRFAGFADTEDSDTELVVRALVCDEAGTDIVSAVSSGLYHPAANADGNGFYGTACDPIDNNYYQPNRDRRKAALGLWTEDALLPSLNQPEVKHLPSAVVEQTYNRVSELVRIDLTYPPLRSGDAVRTTRDYRVKLKFELNQRTTADYGDFYLLFCHLFPAPSY